LKYKSLKNIKAKDLNLKLQQKHVFYRIFDKLWTSHFSLSRLFANYKTKTLFGITGFDFTQRNLGFVILQFNKN
jgi:hypothetical protein